MTSVMNAMEQNPHLEDDELEKLLDEIPRATSAPPLLEELQKAYNPNYDDGPFMSSREDEVNVKPFADIRLDEDYEEFYKTYAGVKKLPPPIENRQLYAESPKGMSNHFSPFYGGLSNDDNSRNNFFFRHIQDHPQNQVREDALKHQKQSHSQNVNDIDDEKQHYLDQLERQVHKQRVHQRQLHPNQQDQHKRMDDQDLVSAFNAMNFVDSSDRRHGASPVGSPAELNDIVHVSRNVGMNGTISSTLEAMAAAYNNSANPGGNVPNGTASAIENILSNAASNNSRFSAADIELLNKRSHGLENMNANLSQNSPAIGLEGLINAGQNSGNVNAANLASGNLSAANLQLYDQLLRARGMGGISDMYPGLAVNTNANPTYGGLSGLGLGSNVSGLEGYGLGGNVNLDVLSAAMQARGLSAANPSGIDLLSSSAVNPQQLPLGDYDVATLLQLQRAQQVAALQRLQVQMEEDRLRQQRTLQQQLLLQQQLQDPTSQSQRLNLLNPLTTAGLGLAGATDLARGVSVVCRYYNQGNCGRGDACPFLHISSAAALGIKTDRDRRETDLRTRTDIASDRFLGTRERDDRLPAMDRSVSRGRLSPLLDEHSLTGSDRTVSPQTTLTPSSATAINRRKEVLGPASLSNGDYYDKTPALAENRERAISQLGPLSEVPSFRMSTVTSISAANQPKYNSLEEVEGKIYSIAKDQHGCRFLQRKFDEGSADEISKIFNEIIDYIKELMIDPFGNYLVQKLLEVCTEEQREEILQRVTPDGELVEISLNMHGTRAVQKLIETLQGPAQIYLVIEALKSGVVTLIKDLNGNHVIQRCLQRLSPEDSEFIFDAAAIHCVEIATHRHGCCVLQRCVDFATGHHQERLVAEIAANSLILSQDPFGNYVVQYILDLNLPWATLEVMIRLEGNYAFLAQQKFSSNVVEKCLKLAGEDDRTRIIRELTSSPRLGQLLQDPYANYVIQSALTVAKGALHAALVEAIRPHLQLLRSSPYGKRILSRTNLKK